MTSLDCRDERRREAVRQHRELNGLDFVEVGPGRTTLIAHFLGKVPVQLGPSNLVIEGGRRITGIRVQQVKMHRTELLEFDDTMEVELDQEGDFSTYSLRVVARGPDGQPHSHPSFDPRYDRAEFSFKTDCPSDMDCHRDAGCPSEHRPEPVIQYLAKDYASFRQLMLDRLSLVMPEWKERHVPDLGIALVEVLAYTGDYLSYYQDAVATEAYLDTARQRISVRRHARLVDYFFHEGCNARTWVCLETDSLVTLDPRDIRFVTRLDTLGPIVKATDLAQTGSVPYEAFEPMTADPIRLYPGHHEFRLYAWGDRECCVPKGATSATLVGQWVGEKKNTDPVPCDPAVEAGQGKPSLVQPTGPALHLQIGDVVIFEEVVGLRTGNPADADRAHRHPVRITRLTTVVDPLVPGLALTEIHWAAADALPFPLCVSVLGPPPHCALIESVTVVRGNLVLVDHGVSRPEPLPPVPVKDVAESCDCSGGLADTVVVPELFRPVLRDVPLTFSEPLVPGIPASRLLWQDPARSQPQIWLTIADPGPQPAVWLRQRDLLASGSRDPHFSVEIDTDGRARLRFGNGEMGRQPAARTVFEARYRIGNGPAGNVGAGAIAHLVTGQQSLSGGILSVRNPLAASGGVPPEQTAQAKLHAPHAFRQQLQRAITPEDYAEIVRRDFPDRVQRAGAALRWNGSWFEMLVAVDGLGTGQASPALLAEIAGHLHRYRRIGHDLAVRPAVRVPLDIELIVCVRPHYLRGHVKAELLAVLGNRDLRDSRRGMFHPDNLSFGEGVYVSKVLAAGQSVEGVESVCVKRFQRLFQTANQEIENGLIPLGPLEIALLDNDPDFPENGRLKLDMRGGR